MAKTAVCSTENQPPMPPPPPILVVESTIEPPSFTIIQHEHRPATRLALINGTLVLAYWRT